MFDPAPINWRDASSTGFRQVCAQTKTLLPHILDAVNQASPSNFSFAVSAIKDELHCISEAFTKSTMDKIPFDEAIVKKHTMTLLLAAVMLHRDKAHSSVKKGDQDHSFLECKFVFEVPSETVKFSTMLVLGFSPTRSHPGTEPMLHVLPEKIVFVFVPHAANVSDSCLSRTMHFPTLLHNVPSTASINGIRHVFRNSIGELSPLLRITIDQDKSCPVECPGIEHQASEHKFENPTEGGPFLV
jgi:hypothetical protein